MSSGVYTQRLYQRWSEDKQSVSLEWQKYFNENSLQIQNNSECNFEQQQQVSEEQKHNIDLKAAKLYNLLRAYRYRGHEQADVDPLELDQIAKQQSGYIDESHHLELSHKNFGFQDEDLDEVIISQAQDSLGFFMKEQSTWTLRQIIDKMRQIYCQKIGYEFLHIQEEVQKLWIRKQIEESKFSNITNQEKISTFDNLLKNHQFNEFMKNTFSTSKRFGIEGLDSMIGGLNALIEYSGSVHDIQHMVLGMAHRGRLNTLALVFDKPFDEIFAEFQDLKGEAVAGMGGDVKYHLGTTTHKQLKQSGKEMELTILPNPSHLETVNPVVYGTVKAIQDFTGDSQGGKSFGVIIHGDAAFAGQGVVYESLQFQNLTDYKSGGIIHIISNNQIGFTTTPVDARTGLYCTEIAKAINAPIFHVNADSPDQVDRVMRLAFEYRQMFKKDVIIDIIGYRKFGHNELDQPSFTQPLMYKKINSLQPVYIKYKNQLIKENILQPNQIQQQEQLFYDNLQLKYLNSKKHKFNFSKWQSKCWEAILSPKLLGENIKDTGFEKTKITQLGLFLNNITELELHPQLKKIYQLRIKSIEDGKGIDYATAEQLAFGSLIQEGYGIRLSGQDVERGTFSHRHAVLHDQSRDFKFTPLHKLLDKSSIHRATFCNSHLSEYGVLGFEYGYALANPNYLVMWEAQFGDFSNEAQIIIDNYISSCESKWGVQVGLTLLLPHGMDGQGPEHSSARIERFLALLDDNPYDIRNIQVVQPSTAAQYFHVLRRQMKRDFRKPLICFNSKKLLRYKQACSEIEEMQQGTRFQRIIQDQNKDSLQNEQISIVTLCSGQAYFELTERRTQLQANNMAIIRIEQIAPFSYEQFKDLAKQYKNAKFIWFQEEHQNMGPWTYLEPRINLILNELNEQVNGFQCKEIQYVGRNIQSSPASGQQKKHKIEQEEILKTLFNHL